MSNPQQSPGNEAFLQETRQNHPKPIVLLNEVDHDLPRTPEQQRTALSGIHQERTREVLGLDEPEGTVTALDHRPDLSVETTELREALRRIGAGQASTLECMLSERQLINSPLTREIRQAARKPLSDTTARQYLEVARHLHQPVTSSESSYAAVSWRCAPTAASWPPSGCGRRES